MPIAPNGEKGVQGATEGLQASERRQTRHGEGVSVEGWPPSACCRRGHTTAHDTLLSTENALFCSSLVGRLWSQLPSRQRQGQGT